jgi:hypothetical protein
MLPLDMVAPVRASKLPAFFFSQSGESGVAEAAADPVA